MDENRAPGGLRVEKTNAVAGVVLDASGDKNGQALDDEASFAAAQIIQPDQPETEDGVGRERIFGRSDGRERGRAFSKQCARVAWRQAVMQVGLGAQFRHTPIGKLAMQRLAEALAVLEPRTTAVGIAIGGAVQIDQRERAGAASEMLDFEFEPSGALELHAGDAARQVARHAPAFDGDRGATPGERKRIGGDGERVFARLHQNWFSAGLEKTLNRQVRLVRITARGLTGGRLQWLYYGAAGNGRGTGRFRAAQDSGSYHSGAGPAARSIFGIQGPVQFRDQSGQIFCQRSASPIRYCVPSMARIATGIVSEALHPTPSANVICWR